MPQPLVTPRHDVQPLDDKGLCGRSWYLYFQALTAWVTELRASLQPAGAAVENSLATAFASAALTLVAGTYNDIAGATLTLAAAGTYLVHGVFDFLGAGAGDVNTAGLGRLLVKMPVVAVSNAVAAVVTKVNHGLTTGDNVTFSGATGAWTGLNAAFVATVPTSDSFSVPLDSSAFGALTGTVIATAARPGSVLFQPLMLAGAGLTGSPVTLRQTAAQQWRVVATAGDVLQLQAEKNGGTGTSTAQTNTSISALWVKP